MYLNKRKLDDVVYDMINGRDLLQYLKIIIDFEYQVIKWENTSVPMRYKL